MGAVCADNFETGTLSAICGGTTTILAFAKQQREEKERSLIDVIDEYHGEATGKSYCDYGFHLIITGTPTSPFPVLQLIDFVSQLPNHLG